MMLLLSSALAADADPLRLRPDEGAFFVAEDAQAGPAGLDLRLTGQVAKNPWTLVDPVTGLEDPVVGRLAGATLSAGWSEGRFRGGFELPVLADPGGFGDARASVRWLALPGADENLGLSFTGELRAPGVSPSETPAGAAVGFAADWRQGPLLVAAGASVGTDQRLGFTAGAAWDLTENAGLSMEVVGSSPLGAEFLAVGQQSPVELLGGLRYQPGSLNLRLVGGRGLTWGVGAPDWRVMLAIGFSPGRSADLDLDGIVDRTDLCPSNPEDLDAFQDEDGCADADNDADAMDDPLDECPNSPEDLDGWQDADGCPEADALLRLRVVDPRGNPVEAQIELGGEVIRGSEAERHLEVGRADLAVRAPGWKPWFDSLVLREGGTELEARLEPAAGYGLVQVAVLGENGPLNDVTVRVDGGPPTPTKGLMSLPQGAHQLQLSAPGHFDTIAPVEVRSGQTAELIVELPPALATLDAGGQVTLAEPLLFAPGSATIDRHFWMMLDDLAALVVAHPELGLLVIEGHAETTETQWTSVDLAARRAQAVAEALVSRGVDPRRIMAVGMGVSQPKKAESAEAGRAATRRVEMHFED